MYLYKCYQLCDCRSVQTPWYVKFELKTHDEEWQSRAFAGTTPFYVINSLRLDLSL